MQETSSTKTTADTRHPTPNTRQRTADTPRSTPRPTRAGANERLLLVLVVSLLLLRKLSLAATIVRVPAATLVEQLTAHSAICHVAQQPTAQLRSLRRAFPADLLLATMIYASTLLSPTAALPALSGSTTVALIGTAQRACASAATTTTGAAATATATAKTTAAAAIDAAVACAAAAKKAATVCADALADLWAHCQLALQRLFGLDVGVGVGVGSSSAVEDTEEPTATATATALKIPTHPASTASAGAAVDAKDVREPVSESAPGPTSASVPAPTLAPAPAPVPVPTPAPQPERERASTIPREITEHVFCRDALAVSYEAVLIARYEALGPVPFDTVLRLISCVHRRNHRCAFDLAFCGLTIVDIVLRALECCDYDVAAAYAFLMDWGMFYRVYDLGDVVTPEHGRAEQRQFLVTTLFTLV